MARIEEPPIDRVLRLLQHAPDGLTTNELIGCGIRNPREPIWHLKVQGYDIDSYQDNGETRYKMVKHA